MGRNATIIFGILSLGLLGANIGLQRQNAKLAGNLEDVYDERGPHPGNKLSSISGTRLSGEAVTATFSNSSLLLLFSARCKYCSENWPRWKELVNGVRPGIQVVYADVTDSVSANYLAQYMIRLEG